jgi:hypothetical protein
MTSVTRLGPAVAAVALALALVTAAFPTLAKKPKAKAKAEEPIPALPLSIAVAQEDGRPVRDDAWIDAQIAESQRLFSQCGVHLRKAPPRALDARFMRLETRKDRDDLATELEKGRINVMIVASLRDVDDPSLLRMGVHWRPQSNLRKHYIIVAASALPSTLAHELGHYFGNAHSSVTDNVMSYDRTGATVFFDASQKRKVKTFARLFLRSKELEP